MRLSSAPRTMRWAALGLLPLLAAACTPVAQRTAATPHRAIQSFAPATMQPVSSAADTVKTNLPSAPLNTPLCGTHLRADAQMGAAIYPTSLASGNACTANACFQPLTGTYFASNGEPTVCR